MPHPKRSDTESELYCAVLVASLASKEKLSLATSDAELAADAYRERYGAKVPSEDDKRHAAFEAADAAEKYRELVTENASLQKHADSYHRLYDEAIRRLDDTPKAAVDLLALLRLDGCRDDGDFVVYLRNRLEAYAGMRDSLSKACAQIKALEGTSRKARVRLAQGTGTIMKVLSQDVPTPRFEERWEAQCQEGMSLSDAETFYKLGFADAQIGRDLTAEAQQLALITALQEARKKLSLLCYGLSGQAPMDITKCDELVDEAEKSLEEYE